MFYITPINPDYLNIINACAPPRVGFIRHLNLLFITNNSYFRTKKTHNKTIAMSMKTNESTKKNYMMMQPINGVLKQQITSPHLMSRTVAVTFKL